MALNSINYNASAIAALSNLNSTSQGLTISQNRISTGQAISVPGDNSAIWAIAQRTRADSSALDAVIQSLQRNQSVNDTATAAATQVADLLNQIKAKVVSASDTSIDAASRTALNTDVNSLILQINRTVSNASFNGANLIKSGATALAALADSAGGKLTISAQILSVKVGGVNTNITFSAGASFTTATTANSLLTLVNTSITNVTAAIAKLGTNSNALATHVKFVQSLQDQLNNGVSNLVDADVAKESATLQALQTRQQLGVQALQIANASKGALLSLFR